MKFLDIRCACPCGMRVLANIYKQMDVGDEPFNNMIGHLRRTGSLTIKRCEEMHEVRLD